MNETNETQSATDTGTQAIYYWMDGYWITDPEEAELMDSINAFGSQSQRLDVADGEDIQTAVNRELAQAA
ncbi:MAG: hypothetical protein R3E95_22490 [Thiolinea sp.]